MKKRLLLAAALLTFSSLSLSVPTLAGEEHNFTLINGMGVPLTHFYVGASTEEEWGEDILGTEVLANGEESEIDFSETADEGCEFDVKIVENNGKAWTVMNVDLCETSSITFKKQGGKVVYTKG